MVRHLQLVKSDEADRVTDAGVSAIEQKVAEAETRAAAMLITNDAEAEVAGEVLREIARLSKAAEGERRELVDPLNATVKKINARFKDAAAPFKAADEIIRGKLGAYQAEQERAAEEERRRLEAERQERERKAREEREKREAQARAEREKAEKEAAEAAELAADDDSEEMADLAAEAHEKAQEAATAVSALESLPEPSLPKAMVEAAKKPAGVSSRRVWKHTIEDPVLVPREFLAVDEKKIREAVRQGVRQIPGVRIEQVDEMAVRG